MTYPYPAGPWVPDPEAVPAEIRDRDQWVRFTLVPQEGKKPKKVPLRPSGAGAASSTDPSTWGDFTTALANIGKDGSVGIGYVFTEEDPYVGIDFDDVLEDGRLHPAVAPLVEDLATYTEVSPSGCGVKLFGRRDHPLPAGIAHKAPGPVGEIEAYDWGRFFTVTGNLLPGAPEDVRNVNGALDAILERYFAKRTASPGEDLPAGVPELHDDDAAALAMRLVSRATAAIAGGAKRHDTIRGALLQARHNRVPYEMAERMLPALLDAANAIPGKEPYPLAQLQRLLRWTWEHVTPGEPWTETKRKLESYQEEDDAHAGTTWRALTAVLLLARPRTPIPTGFSLLDSTFLGGGLAPGDAVAVGGPPGAGKTTFVAALAANLAGPKTHVGFAAFDEPEEKVAAKVGARFGEAFHRLNSDYPSVLESLEERLAIKDATIEFVDPLGAPDVETILETFAARVPAGKVGVLFLDHLHLLESRDTTDRDNEFDTVRKVATAVAVLTRKLGLITVSIAEVLKAASSPDAVRNNPLGAFAGTRKIASLFTVPMVMVPAEGGGFELILAKNRLGPRGSAILNVNFETWNVTVDSVRTASRGTGTLGEESRTATVAKADDDVLRSFFAESEPMPWNDAEAALRALGVARNRAVESRRRLRMAGELAEVPGVRPDDAGRGPVPSFWTSPEKLSRTVPKLSRNSPAVGVSLPERNSPQPPPCKGVGRVSGGRKAKSGEPKKSKTLGGVSPSPEVRP